MDFNQLKDLKSTWGENRTIVPEWVEGQSFYVVSDELLKQLINEINESRLLREQIATGIEAISDYQVLETTNRKGFESQMEVTDAVKKLAIAIARGNDGNLPLG